MNYLNTRRDIIITIVGLGVGGTLFAGYLTIYRAMTGICALGEGCPIVLGLPACIYGFGMFLAITAIGLQALLMDEKSWMNKAVIGLSGFGICFAGFLSATEIAGWMASGRSYALVMPSCVYGLVFYVAIFALSLRLQRLAK